MSDTVKTFCKLTIEAPDADLAGWVSSAVIEGTGAVVALSNKELGGRISCYPNGFLWSVDCGDQPTRDGESELLKDAVEAVKAAQHLRQQHVFVR